MVEAAKAKHRAKIQGNRPIMPRKLNEQQFCGWCGSKVDYDSDWLSTCSSCSYKRYLNPYPCCNVMVEKDGRILMVKRAIEPQLGKYDLPGGFMDMTDESIEDAAYRELNEEIGIDENKVSKLSYLGSHTTPYTWMDSEIMNVCSFFACSLLADESSILIDEKENQAHTWVRKEDLHEIDFAWDIDKTMIEKYFQEVS